MFLTFLQLSVKYALQILIIVVIQHSLTVGYSSQAAEDSSLRYHKNHHEMKMEIKISQTSTMISSYLYQTGQLFIPKDVLEYHISEMLLTCTILRKRTERTENNMFDSCCSFLLSDNLENFYENFCFFCMQYLNIHVTSVAVFCKKNFNAVQNYFEIHNQMTKRKERRFHKRDVNSKDNKSTKDIPKKDVSAALYTTDSALHVTKREINDTVNSTIPGMADWEAILQMEYSKAPQWALICMVFVVTIIISCVWYTGMCNNRQDEYIDPVMTHNLQPEYVKDIVSRKAKFLAWFKYLRKQKEQQQRLAESRHLIPGSEEREMTERDQLISDSEEDPLFDQTDMSAL